MLCVDGTADANGLPLGRGQAAWVAFSEPAVTLTGSATAFACTTGLI